MEKAIEKTREVAKGEDLQAIKSAVEELEQAGQALNKTLYENTTNNASTGAPEDGASSGAEESAADDDTIDAEFEVKDS